MKKGFHQDFIPSTKIWPKPILRVSRWEMRKELRGQEEGNKLTNTTPVKDATKEVQVAIDVKNSISSHERR